MPNYLNGKFSYMAGYDLNPSQFPLGRFSQKIPRNCSRAFEGSPEVVFHASGTQWLRDNLSLVFVSGSATIEWTGL